MKQKMTNAQAAWHLDGLRRLAESDGLVSAGTGYRIVQNLRTLTEALVPYEETRSMIVRKYTPAGRETLQQSEDPEAYAACLHEIQELGRMELEAEVRPVSPEAISACKLPIGTLLALDFMLLEADRPERGEQPVKQNEPPEGAGG